jgi:hypothetical protein
MQSCNTSDQRIGPEKEEFAEDQSGHLAVKQKIVHSIVVPTVLSISPPVTKSEARDAKKTAVPAHSSGLPKRPAGLRY